jgi:hypothetical protein
MSNVKFFFLQRCRSAGLYRLVEVGRAAPPGGVGRQDSRTIVNTLEVGSNGRSESI